MKLLVKLVLVLSALGLIASLLVHIASLLGIDLNLGTSVFLLHIGIFVVWLPTMFLFVRLGRGKSTSILGFGSVSWKQVLSGCPPWMRYLLYAAFVYTFVNFFIAMQQIEGAPNVSSPSSPLTMRGFSGHWLLFYLASFTVSYSAMMRPELLANASCSAGHKANPTEKFCSECGGPVSIHRNA